MFGWEMFLTDPLLIVIVEWSCIIRVLGEPLDFDPFLALVGRECQFKVLVRDFLASNLLRRFDIWSVDIWASNLLRRRKYVLHRFANKETVVRVENCQVFAPEIVRLLILGILNLHRSDFLDFQSTLRKLFSLTWRTASLSSDSLYLRTTS